MIPKKNRVSRDSFEKIGRGGKVVHSASFSLKYLKNKDILGENESKIAIVVSKKVSKISPKRNLIKRRVSSILNKQKTIENKGHLMIFYIKPGALDKTFTGIKEEILFLLKKAEIL